MKAGFLGPKGTFSQEAFDICYRGTALGVEYPNIIDAILAVESEEVEEAIVPIENSIEGSVTATLDTFAKVNLNIIKEVIIPIRHFFAVKPGTKLDDIEAIFTHPQSAGQCRNYLNKNFPKTQINLTYSNAESARLVAEGDGKSAGIIPEKAAQIYGIDIIERDIQDNNSNETRFVVLSKQSAAKTGQDKTSIVFSTEDEPGSLYKILDIFSLWDINLTKIESRPQKDRLGKYIFFVDLEGHIEDDDIRDALTMVQRKTSYFKHLGSYPMCQIK